MYTIDADNVHDGLIEGLMALKNSGELRSSRAGDVTRLPWPCITHYEAPFDMAMRSPARDANPFFHLAEVAWMLSGKSDGKILDYYVSDFSARFGEEGGDIHGAYGYRWRYHFDFDQIKCIGDILKIDATSRQAVLAMWDPGVDLGAMVKDKPCNTHVYFSCVSPEERKFSMTVCCRSNDIIWGAYGANAVHMWALGEIVSALAGGTLQRYYQVSNDFHMYESIREKADAILEEWEHGYTQHSEGPISPFFPEGLSQDDRRYMALEFLDDCSSIVWWIVEDSENRASADTPFGQVISRCLHAHRLFRKDRVEEALLQCQHVQDTYSVQWGLACRQWIERRLERRTKK